MSHVALPAPLTPLDEAFAHQSAETFAMVGTSDPAWAERLYCRAVDLDGQVSVALGMGRYVNRGVMDGYAMVSTGNRQHTVRASRSLSGDPTSTVVGPIRYEVVRPLEKVRFVLEPNDVQPIAFDLTLTARDAPVTERNQQRRGLRQAIDVTRYVQVGVAEGVVEVNGMTSSFKPEASFAARDHSWGIRGQVGPPPVDRPSDFQIKAGTDFRMLWAPCWIDTPQGKVILHLAHWDARSESGLIEFNDVQVRDSVGRHSRPTASWRPEYSVDRRTLQRVHVDLRDGALARRLTLEVIGDSANCLGPALYGGFRGRYHGEYLGRLKVEGELIEDTNDPALQPELRQLRDLLVRVVDRDSGETGWGCAQVEAVGDFDDPHIPPVRYR